jgi:hypothetical protein
MIIQSLVTAFVLAFIAIAIFGHVLVLRAAFTPAGDRSSGKRDKQQASHHAPMTGARIAAQGR